MTRDEWIAAAIAEAPPFTAEQVAALRSILASSGQRVHVDSDDAETTS